MPGKPPIKRALISVYDKTGIVDFARALHEEFGIEIISTGGTAQVLREAGIPVTLVENLTGFGEMLGGRVKTLHPAIHAGILADRDNPEHMRQLEAAGIKPIDLVVVNLYPFEKTIADPNCSFEQAIEMIDIGGVALLRAAAKNHRHVITSCGRCDWHECLEVVRGDHVESEPDVRLRLASNALLCTSSYDAQITGWLSRCLSSRTGWPGTSAIFLRTWGALRYGENPHQCAELHQHGSVSPDLTTADAMEDQEDRQDRFSLNNYLDADAALGLCAELTRAGPQLSRPGSAQAALSAPSSSSETERDAKQQVSNQPTDGSTQPSPGIRPSAGSTPRACVFVKHTNACGAGIHADPAEAYRRAYLGDPNAAMGGILAVNFDVDAAFAALVMETYERFGKPLKEAGAPGAPGAFFIEVWIAPEFTKDAIAIIRGTYPARPATSRTGAPAAPGPKAGVARPAEPRIAAPPRKKWGENVRLLAVGDMSVPPDPNELQYRSIAGGVLAQTPDRLGLDEEHWKVVTERGPTAAEMADLRVAWLICKHTKSNAISLVRDGTLIGNGAGQMSRIMSCRIATWLARENGHLNYPALDRPEAGPPVHNGCVAASDAFFPFSDGPQILIDAGVTAIIQPGGSKRDQETIDLCNQRGVAMIHTGTRHFRH